MRKNLSLALALTIPTIIYFCVYFFNHPADLHSTGFIQYDNVSYIAYAKQYLDQGDIHLQYSNPFNDSNNYQPIYFQTQTILFAILLKAGLPPGYILPFFTIICTFFCFLLIIKIYELVRTTNTGRNKMLWLFAWGGGLLVIAGIVYHFAARTGHSLPEDFFAIDPENGWWGLSLGRALFFTCEAYYHLLFLLCIYFLLKRNYLPSLIFSFLLTLSHPFTGIELALILIVYFVFEYIYGTNKPPAWFGIGAILIAAFHIYFYLFYLEQFPDHQSVSHQYSLNWILRYYRMIPAYVIVATFAIISIYKTSVRKYFQVHHNRIFLCWFVVAFLLANHEVFIAAKQPIHFTRGYIWTSLFLLGIPALNGFVNRLTVSRSRILLLLLMSLFLMDNFVWIGQNIFSQPGNPDYGYISTEQKQLFKILNQNSSNNTLLICKDNTISYLSTVYTAAYPLYSHPYTTPFAEKKLKQQEDFYTKGVLDSSFAKREIVFVIQQNDSIAARTIRLLPAKTIAATKHYSIFKISSL